MKTINVNHPTESEFCGLTRVGKTKAAVIVAGGPFKDLYELSKLKGCGKYTIDAIIGKGVTVL